MSCHRCSVVFFGPFVTPISDLLPTINTYSALLIKRLKEGIFEISLNRIFMEKIRNNFWKKYEIIFGKNILYFFTEESHSAKDQNILLSFSEEENFISLNQMNFEMRQIHFTLAVHC